MEILSTKQKQRLIKRLRETRIRSVFRYNFLLSRQAMKKNGQRGNNWILQKVNIKNKMFFYD